LGARKAKEIAKSNRKIIPAKEKLAVEEARAKQLAAEEEGRVKQSPNKAVMKLMEVARESIRTVSEKIPICNKIKQRRYHLQQNHRQEN
jgi:hypothetical protein